MKKESNGIGENKNSKKINKNNKIISSILAVIMCCQSFVGANPNSDNSGFVPYGGIDNSPAADGFEEKEEKEEVKLVDGEKTVEIMEDKDKDGVEIPENENDVKENDEDKNENESKKGDAVNKSKGLLDLAKTIVGVGGISGVGTLVVYNAISSRKAKPSEKPKKEKEEEKEEEEKKRLAEEEEKKRLAEEEEKKRLVEEETKRLFEEEKKRLAEEEEKKRLAEEEEKKRLAEEEENKRLFEKEFRGRFEEYGFSELNFLLYRRMMKVLTFSLGNKAKDKDKMLFHSLDITFGGISDILFDAKKCLFNNMVYTRVGFLKEINEVSEKIKAEVEHMDPYSQFVYKVATGQEDISSLTKESLREKLCELLSDCQSDFRLTGFYLSLKNKGDIIVPEGLARLVLDNL